MKSLVRWRACERHHREPNERAATRFSPTITLRVGQITADGQLPAGYALTEQRLDETEVGEGTAIPRSSTPRARPA